MFEREARVQYSYSSGYFANEGAIKDAVMSTSSACNEVCIEVSDVIKILALRARTPRSNTTLEHHVRDTTRNPGLEQPIE